MGTKVPIFGQVGVMGMTATEAKMITQQSQAAIREEYLRSLRQQVLTQIKACAQRGSFTAAVSITDGYSKFPDEIRDFGVTLANDGYAVYICSDPSSSSSETRLLEVSWKC